MNRFILHEDPVVAAQMHCDKHVVKMVLEEAQMLSTAHRVADSFVIRTHVPKQRSRTEYYFEPGDSREGLLYLVTHKNHPCSVWARASRANYSWASSLLHSLLNEYEYRYSKIHKIRRTGLERALMQYPRGIPDSPRTPFPLAMPDEYKRYGDAVGSYRTLYRLSKSRFAAWNRGRSAPDWYSEELDDR